MSVSAWIDYESGEVAGDGNWKRKDFVGDQNRRLCVITVAAQGDRMVYIVCCMG